MNLIGQVQKVCQDLAAKGWHEYLGRVSGLDICLADPDDLAQELARPLEIKRGVEGLGDFAGEGTCAIEPGVPARSFLYHALASPHVARREVDGFPSWADLEMIENYVFGVAPPSMMELRRRAGDAPLALVVYATEYRPAFQTVHQRHADLCFSRTGLARVGTEAARYLGEARGYSSLGPDAQEVYAVPCRFSAYIAAHCNGDPDSFGPLRFRTGTSVDPSGSLVRSDAQRRFWVPLHKVFPGRECIRGLDLELRFRTDHCNEKLRRVFLYLQQEGKPTDCHNLTRAPFVIPESELASVTPLAAGAVSHLPSGSLVTLQSGGSIVVAPRARPLAQEARVNGRRLGLLVPPDSAHGGGALELPSRPTGGRAAPEYVYVRQEIRPDNTLQDLTNDPDVVGRIRQGRYRAQLYCDYVGDGWVWAECEELSRHLPQQLAAYSVLAPPDLYPKVKQHDVMSWWQQSVPADIRATLFPDFQTARPPEPLSESRITANLTFRIPRSGFRSAPVFESDDDTYTAIVSLLGAGGGRPTRLEAEEDDRVSPLPDGAAGLFAPGWDLSIDHNADEGASGGVLHLAAYGGGSPFLEDVRLCAALSAFWPAVAPDTSRLYEPGRFPAVTPIPQSRLGWDGLAAPKVLAANTVEVHSYAYTDYVSASLRRALNFQRIGRTSVSEYETWTLLMARVYQALGATATGDKAKWAVIEFDQAAPDDPALAEAQDDVGRNLQAPYRFCLIRPVGTVKQPANPRLATVSFQRRVLAFATPLCVLYKDSQHPDWVVREF